MFLQEGPPELDIVGERSQSGQDLLLGNGPPWEALQEQGCIALATILRVATVELNGVWTVMQAMENYPSNAVAQEQGRPIIKSRSESSRALCALALSQR